MNTPHPAHPPAPVPGSFSFGDAAGVDLGSITNLTATLRADYVALQNDLEQAQDLAAEFQRQLAGKSNELAHFKTLLEKTQMDLGRMEGHVAELRRERHRLANQVMVVPALQIELQQTQKERDQFRKEVEELRSALTGSAGGSQERIAELTATVERLEATIARQAAAQGRPSSALPPAALAGGDDFIDITFES